MPTLHIDLRPLSAKRLGGVLRDLMPGYEWEVVITPEIDPMAFYIEGLDAKGVKQANNIVNLWLLMGHSDGNT